uniref:uncharacterized protein LOC122588447 n=1 Tax=Erigeron canadensis TaxID=72917 RepID=UPI001CB9ABFD|nr:uncharacterized protein LOC122588447 [Erigeron canadensis]
MVKMMKWMAWPPLPSKKYQANIVVECLHGMQNVNEGLCVEVEWRGCRKSNSKRIKSLIKSRDSVIKRDVTNEGIMLKGGDGSIVVEWNEEFVGVCEFVEFRDLWEAGFIVSNGLNQGPKRWDHVVATGSLNLAEFASLEQEKAQIDIHLSVPNSTHCSPILSVSLSLKEVKTADDMTELTGFRKIKIFKLISANRAKKGFQEEEGSYGNSSVRSEDADYPFDTDSLEGTDGNDSEDVDYADSNIKKSLSYGSLASYFNSRGSEDEDRIYYKSYNITKDADDLNVTTIDQSEKQVLKSSFFPWRKRKLNFRSPKPKGEPLLKRDLGEEGGDDIDFDRRMLTSSDDSSHGWHRSEDGSTTSRSSFSEFGDDNFVVGKWDTKEVISRDGHMKLQTQVFFASIDQRSERASGESACTSLVTIIADWFQNNRHQMPIKSELDTLIREGSFEWRNLCENEFYRKRFPDKHFDLETVLQAKTRNLVVVPEKSFIGFFQPNGLQEGIFDFLDGAMSFDAIWDEISEIGSNHSNHIDPLVYIVSWNDHFFILKVEKDAYYIIDTLGERLYEGCNQAYILKFDQDTTIQRKSNDKLDKSSFSEIKKEESMVSKGKESCKEYIKSFLAAIPLRDLQADVKKGLMAASSPLVHHRLQIEFHYTKSL